MDHAIIRYWYILMQEHLCINRMLLIIQCFNDMQSVWHLQSSQHISIVCNQLLRTRNRADECGNSYINAQRNYIIKIISGIKL